MKRKQMLVMAGVVALILLVTVLAAVELVKKSAMLMVAAVQSDQQTRMQNSSQVEPLWLVEALRPTRWGYQKVFFVVSKRSPDLLFYVLVCKAVCGKKESWEAKLPVGAEWLEWVQRWEDQFFGSNPGLIHEKEARRSPLGRLAF